MSIAERITQARHDRDARRAARAEMTKLATELAAYRTPADRMEIELLAARSDAPGAEVVRDLLDQMRADEAATGARFTR